MYSLLVFGGLRLGAEVGGIVGLSFMHVCQASGQKHQGCSVAIMCQLSVVPIFYNPHCWKSRFILGNAPAAHYVSLDSS